jgi:hypothetical protein
MQLCYFVLNIEFNRFHLFSHLFSFKSNSIFLIYNNYSYEIFVH